MTPTTTITISTLVGSITLTNGTVVTFTTPPDDEPDDGPAGVREPRTPKPTAPVTTAAVGP